MRFCWEGRKRLRTSREGTKMKNWKWKGGETVCWGWALLRRKRERAQQDKNHETLVKGRVEIASVLLRQATVCWWEDSWVALAKLLLSTAKVEVRAYGARRNRGSQHERRESCGRISGSLWSSGVSFPEEKAGKPKQRGRGTVGLKCPKINRKDWRQWEMMRRNKIKAQIESSKRTLGMDNKAWVSRRDGKKWGLKLIVDENSELIQFFNKRK